MSLIEGLAGGGPERSSSQKRKFLDNDWGEAAVVNGARFGKVRIGGIPPWKHCPRRVHAEAGQTLERKFGTTSVQLRERKSGFSGS